MRYFKALTPDRKTFFYNIVEWKLGVPMPVVDAPKDGNVCGPGYHLGKSISAAVRHVFFPLRVFEAEPAGDLLGEDFEKARFASAKITREVQTPAWVLRLENFILAIEDLQILNRWDEPQDTWKLFPTRAEARISAARAGRERDIAWAAAWDSSKNVAKDTVWAISWGIPFGDARDVEWDAARTTAAKAVVKMVKRVTQADSSDFAWSHFEQTVKSSAADWSVAWKDAKEDSLGSASDLIRDASLMARVIICHELPLDQRHRIHAWKRWDVWRRGYGVFCDLDGVLYCYGSVP